MVRTTRQAPTPGRAAAPRPWQQCRGAASAARRRGTAEPGRKGCPTGPGRAATPNRPTGGGPGDRRLRPALTGGEAQAGQRQRQQECLRAHRCGLRRAPAADPRGNWGGGWVKEGGAGLGGADQASQRPAGSTMTPTVRQSAPAAAQIALPAASQSQPGQRRAQVSGPVNRRVGQTRWGMPSLRPARRRPPLVWRLQAAEARPQPPALARTVTPESSGAAAVAAGAREAPRAADAWRRRWAAERQRGQHTAPPSMLVPPRELDLQIPGLECCTEAWGGLCTGPGDGQAANALLHVLWLPGPCNAHRPPRPCAAHPPAAAGRQSRDPAKQQAGQRARTPCCLGCLGAARRCRYAAWHTGWARVLRGR